MAVVRKVGVPMRTVVLAASKGGVGKTTLAAALAVRAAEESGNVALIDLDPQGSLGRWWELRGEPDNPRLVTNVETLAPAIATLRTMGIGWLFIDTPPAIIGTIEPAIRAADVVLVPVKASPLDIEAVDPVVQLCVRRGRPFAFVMSMVEYANPVKRPS